MIGLLQGDITLKIGVCSAGISNVTRLKLPVKAQLILLRRVLLFLFISVLAPEFFKARLLQIGTIIRLKSWGVVIA